jgi:flagellar motor switch protein FliN/FliY
MAAPKLVIQFALGDLPENTHVVLISQETFADIGALARKVDPSEISDIDDNLVADARPIVEAIVQGMCLAIGNIKNEPLTSNSLTVRFQIFNFPPSLQRAENVVRTNIAIGSDQVNGTLTWIIDSESLESIVGEKQGSEAFPASMEEIQARELEHMPDESGNLEILLDIPMEISVELGRVRMLVKDVVDLGSGSIIEIDKAAGEPVDVLVNGRLVARGEVVVIEDNFGVRLTEVLSPAERLQRLSEAA